MRVPLPSTAKGAIDLPSSASPNLLPVLPKKKPRGGRGLSVPTAWGSSTPRAPRLHIRMS
jgi:hypothetical protein